MDIPISESSVTLQLSLIQKRCRELMDDSTDLQLTLEESVADESGSDPYNQHR